MYTIIQILWVSNFLYLVFLKCIIFLINIGFAEEKR